MTSADTAQVFIAVLATGAGAFVQGCLGFGMALLASPILAMVGHQFVPGPLTLCGLVVSALNFARDWRSVDFARMPAILPTLILGSWIGARLLFAVPADLLSVFLGSIVLVAVGLSALGGEVTPTRTNVAVAGLAAGFLSTTASIPGPPVAMVYRDVAPDRLRGTLALIFLCTGIMSLINLSAIGKLTFAELQLAATLAPGVLVGFVSSRFAVGRLPAPLMRVGVLGLSASAGLAAIVRGLSS